jgi:uncharacterized RDD family membrane protein YckC
MSDSTGAVAGSTNCWNCGQPLSIGAAQCVFCGMAQQQAQPQPTPFLVAPDGVAPVPHVPVQTWTPGAPAPSAPTRGALDPAFAGTAAGVGRQLAAFSIDVAAVVAVAVAVLLIAGSPVYAALAVVELAVGLWVLEARTGATIGNAVVRIRTSRDDEPFSPGIGRAFVRRMPVAVGFVAAGVGAWVAAASGAWDGSGRSRSWGDLAAKTQIVSVPVRGSVERPIVQPAGAISPEAEPHVVLAAPQVMSTLARPRAVDEDSQVQTGAPTRASAAAPMSAPPRPPAVDRGAAAPASDVADGTLLLVFDTGQRVQFPTPVSVNLGRSPVSTEPSDMLVTVEDPEMTVSKTHLRLEHSRGRTWVTDGGSTNGSDLLDDEGGVTTLAPGNRVLLDEGVRVRIGNRAFTISLILGGER